MPEIDGYREAPNILSEKFTRRQGLKLLAASLPAIPLALTSKPSVVCAVSPEAQPNTLPISSPTPSKDTRLAPLPLRTREEAIKSYGDRYGKATNYGDGAFKALSIGGSIDSIIDDMLKDTHPARSTKFGLTNYHFLRPWEGEIGHFTFPSNPMKDLLTDGLQSYNLLSNSGTPYVNLQEGEKPEEFTREVFDRTVYAMNRPNLPKSIGAAVLEIDSSFTEAKIRYHTKLLREAGVSFYVTGNEVDVPGAKQWRNNPERSVWMISIINETLNSSDNKQGYKVALPSFAYGGDRDSLPELISLFNDFRRTLTPPERDRVSIYPYHFYGSPKDLTSSIDAEYDRLCSLDAGDLKMYIFELGFPGLHENELSDSQLAQGLMIQTQAIIAASNRVEMAFFHAAFHPSIPYFSLFGMQGNTLVPKDTFKAYSSGQALFTDTENIEGFEEDDYMGVRGLKNGMLPITVEWSKGDSEVYLDNPNNDVVIDALGNRLDGEIMLPKAEDPRLYGPVRIILPNS